MKKYHVEFTLHMAGGLDIEAESAEEAKEEVESMSIDELDEGHFTHAVDIELVTEEKE